MSTRIPSEIKTGTDLTNRKIMISCNDVIKYKMLIERLTSEINVLIEVVRVQNDAIGKLRNELGLRRI